MSTKKRNNLPEPTRYLYKDEEAIRNFVAGDALMENCLQQIADILRNENYREKSCPFTKEIALNLDKVEKDRQRRKKAPCCDSTVDFIVGLEKDWLLLVEAKLDVENVKNIPKDIKDKIVHSKDMLKSCDRFCHCVDTTVVLLNNSEFQQKSNHLKKLLANNPLIKPYRVCDFYADYFKDINRRP